MFSPRTYLFVLNDRRLDWETRRDLIELLDKETFIKSCYPGNKTTTSIIPPGFIGYLPDHQPRNPELHDHQTTIKKKKIFFSVAEGVNNEQCVLDFVKEHLAKTFDVVPTLDDIVTINKKWTENTLDFYFAYFEADNTLDIFQLFHPDSNLKIVNEGGGKLKSMIEAYNLIKDSQQKQEMARSISEDILELNIVHSIFHPKQYLVYSMDYERLDINQYSSPTFINFNVLRRHPK